MFLISSGFRLAPDKKNCLVLDFGGNVLRHGPVDAIRVKAQPGGEGKAPAKECPECHTLVATGYSICPECGYAFPPPDRQKHDAQAGTAGILSGEITDERYEVQDVKYYLHFKRNAPDDAPRTLKVEYRLGLNHW
jgi:DNA repair protein RadD